MVRRWRWLVVLAGVGVLLALPSLVGLLPGRAAAVPATELLVRISRSASTPYSGYASATGGLALPVTGQLESIAQLLGGSTRMRVWWRSPADWRVDSMTTTGETGQRRTSAGLWTWDYEDNRATVDRGPLDPPLRLPVAADLLPSGLARRMLTDATSAEVTSLPARRVAGRDTQGLRLRPADRRSTINHVDVWADAQSGIPLRVDVVGADAPAPAMSSQFTDFSTVVPDASVTAFFPPPSARVRQRGASDVAALLSRSGDVARPATLAGLPRNDALRRDGVSGAYGRGVTQLVAVPLSAGQAGGLRRTLSAAPGIADMAAGLSLSVGPLVLFLAKDDDHGTAWLLTGTVSAQTLTAGAEELRHTSGVAS